LIDILLTLFQTSKDKIKSETKIKMDHLEEASGDEKAKETNKENVQSNSQPMVDDEEK